MKSGPTFPERIASIDIGTNTILLLIAEVNHDRIKPLVEEETVVRLGEGLGQKGVLSEEAMKRGALTINQYINQCHNLGVMEIYAVGTSALREAKNASEFLERIKEKQNLSIEVISGEEEALLSFLAVTKDLKKPVKNLLVVDVGGGSTELILGNSHAMLWWVSLPLGIVRFSERFLLSDPVKEEEYRAMVEEIRKQLPAFPLPKTPLPSLSMVSIGGTGTALASVEQELEKFFPEKIHNFVLTGEALRNQLSLYRSMTLAERKKIKGLPASRADVILAGGTILYLILETLGCPSLIVSTHGVRYGLLYNKISDFKSQISD